MNETERNHVQTISSMPSESDPRSVKISKRLVFSQWHEPGAPSQTVQNSVHEPTS